LQKILNFNISIFKIEKKDSKEFQ